MQTKMEPTEFQKRFHSELQIEVDRTIKARVIAGIELLKEKYGENWVEHIDMEKFDIANGERCILGMVYGRYTFGLERLAIPEHEGAVYGFSTLGGGVEDNWEDLQAAWIQELFHLAYEPA